MLQIVVAAAAGLALALLATAASAQDDGAANGDPPVTTTTTAPPPTTTTTTVPPPTTTTTTPPPTTSTTTTTTTTTTTSTVAPDTTAPDTFINRPPREVIRTNKPSFRISYVFGSTEEGSTFACAVDDGAFAPCTWPHRPRLRRGEHTVAVRATDAAGNTDQSPATAAVHIKKRQKRPGGN